MAFLFEDEVTILLERYGWTTLRSGWPDVLCFKTDGETAQIMGVEVKTAHDKIRANQQVCHAWLNAMGLPVYVYTPKTSVEDLQPYRFLEKRYIRDLEWRTRACRSGVSIDELIRSGWKPEIADRPSGKN